MTAIYPLTHNDGTPDKRYSIYQEFCGYAEKRHVLRFCGDFIQSSISASSLAVRAAGHRAALNGAAVIEEVRR